MSWQIYAKEIGLAVLKAAGAAIAKVVATKIAEDLIDQSNEHRENAQQIAKNLQTSPIANKDKN